jgi:hypothetical protein
MRFTLNDPETGSNVTEKIKLKFNWRSDRAKVPSTELENKNNKK